MWTKRGLQRTADELDDMLNADPFLNSLPDSPEYTPDIDEQTDQQIADEKKKNEERMENKEILKRRREIYEEEIGEQAGYNVETDEFYPLSREGPRAKDIFTRYEEADRPSRLHVTDATGSMLYDIIVVEKDKFAVQPIPWKLDYTNEATIVNSQEDVYKILDNALGTWDYWEPPKDTAGTEEGTVPPVTGAYMPAAMLHLAAAFIRF